MKQHTYKDVVKITVAVIVAALLQLRVHAVTYYTPAQQGANTFGKDQFDIDYVLGRIEVDNQTPQNWTDFQTITLDWGGTNGLHTVQALRFSNTSRSSNIYIDHYQQAFYKGETYDIREYVWVNKGYGEILTNLGAVNASCQELDNYVCREFHFYKAGTLKSSNPIEVEFKGIVQLTDCDVDEGYTINNLHGVYLHNETCLERKDSNTFKGTYEPDDIDDSHKTIWAEIYGNAQRPLILKYWGATYHGQELNFQGTSYSGQLVYHPNGAPGSDTKQIISLGYDTTVAGNMFNYPGYQFLGWNQRADGTGTSYTVGETYAFKSNTDLYAQWYELKYTIHYDLNDSDNTIGNAGTATGPGDQIKKWGQTVKIANEPLWVRHKFLGWNTERNGSGDWYECGQSYSDNNDLTLYAIWVIIYKLEVDPQDGLWQNQSLVETFWLENSKEKIIPDAKRTGYNFKGWRINT